jgi:chitinase
MHPRLLRRLLVGVTVLAMPLGIAVAAPAASAAPKSLKVAYFTQWGIYGRSYFVKNVATSGSAARLTHLNYAFANVGADGKCFEANQPGQGDAWADYQRRVGADESVDGVADVFEQPLAGNFNQLKKLKKMFPRLKVQLSIGGWSWSKFFSDAAATPAARRAFVSSCIDLFIKGNLPVLGDPQGGPGAAAGVFDGIDLDWEWPATDGNAGNVIRPEDKRNFTLLLAEFRRQLDAAGGRHKHYSLSAFLPAAPAKITEGFEGSKIFRSLDFATVQGYDFHGTWEPMTNHQSAVRAPAGEPVMPDFTAQNTINAWLASGAPRSKLVLGMPFYGRGWTGVANVNHGLFQSSTGPAPGTFEAGIEDYKTLKTLTGAGGFQVFRDQRAGFAWLFNGSTFWTFDDPVAIARKTAFIRRMGLAGAMAWSLDSDDANGSLVRAMDRGLD